MAPRFQLRRSKAPAKDAVTAAPTQDTPAKATSRPSKVPSVFLGALSSEVDQSDALSEPFQRIWDAAEQVIDAFRRRRLTEDEAAHRLSLLRVRTDDDVEWIVGATTRRWYRKLPGGTWKIAQPPTAADATATATVEKAFAALAALPAPKGLPVPAADVAAPATSSESAAPRRDSAGMPLPLEPREVDVPRLDEPGPAPAPVRPRLLKVNPGALPHAESSFGYGSETDVRSGALPFAPELAASTEAPAETRAETPAAEVPDATATAAPEEGSVASESPAGDSSAVESPGEPSGRSSVLDMLSELSADTGITVQGVRPARDEPAA